MTQETQVQSLFETNDSAQSALKSNNTSKSVLDLEASSTKNGKFFGKNDEQILTHDLCQNSQSISNSSLKANNNFQNTINSSQNLNDTTQNALNASDETNANFKNALNTDTKKPNNAIDTEKSELDLSENSQMPLKSNLHSSDKAKSALTSARNVVLNNNIFGYNVDFSKELENNRNKKTNYKPILRYNKDRFEFLIFTDFTAFDFNLFMCLCFAANAKNNLKIKVSFKDLEFLMGKSEKNQKIDKNPKRLFKQFDKFSEKATKTIVKVVESDGKYSTNTYTGFFDFIKVYEREKVIIIQFNELMVSILNNFVDNYTQLELKQYCELKSKYSKQLYALLMGNLYKNKVLRVERDNLIKYLSMQNLKLTQESDLAKILDECITSLKSKSLFSYLKVEKEYSFSKNKVIAYNFVYKK